jgi:hypothetical protein
VAREDLRDSDVYDPNQIYTGAAKDGQGHSTNIRAKLPDSWMGIIAELVNSPDWPEYKTPQHFYRDAIYHRMLWASRQPDRTTSPRVKTLMALSQGQAALEYLTMRREFSQSYLNSARRTLSDLIGDGSGMAVRETLKELEATIDLLEEPWRSELKREVEAYDRRVYGL